MKKPEQALKCPECKEVIRYGEASVTLPDAFGDEELRPTLHLKCFERKKTLIQIQKLSKEAEHR